VLIVDGVEKTLIQNSRDVAINGNRQNFLIIHLITHILELLPSFSLLLSFIILCSRLFAALSVPLTTNSLFSKACLVTVALGLGRSRPS